MRLLLVSGNPSRLRHPRSIHGSDFGARFLRGRLRGFDDVYKLPHHHRLGSESCGHCGGNFVPSLGERHVRADPVEDSHVEMHHRDMRFDLLAERIGESHIASHAHPHREIAPFDIGCPEALHVRVATDAFLDGPLDSI